MHYGREQTPEVVTGRYVQHTLVEPRSPQTEKGV